MRCSFCNYELNPEACTDCCPECGFTIKAHVDGSINALAVTMPSQLTRRLPAELQSLRPANETCVSFTISAFCSKIERNAFSK